MSETMDNQKHFLDPEVEKNLPAPLADAIRRGSVPDEILKHSHDADEALKAFASHGGQVLELDEATNKRLLDRLESDAGMLASPISIHGQGG
jgi:ACS family allantoate permease-like MFS transporter